MTDKIEITVKVNDKQAPLSSLSDETIRKIKREEQAQAEKNAPVFSYVNDRLIVKLTPEVIWTFRMTVEKLDRRFIQEGTYMSFTPSGVIGAYIINSSWGSARDFYRKPAKPLFTENVAFRGSQK